MHSHKSTNNLQLSLGTVLVQIFLDEYMSIPSRQNIIHTLESQSEIARNAQQQTNRFE